MFTWNTTGLVKGKYTITPHATQVQNEIDTSDNCCLDGLVTITITGDVEGSFEVSILDVVRITGTYGEKQGNSAFSSNSDQNNDRSIIILDVVTCTSHYGEIHP